MLIANLWGVYPELRFFPDQFTFSISDSDVRGLQCQSVLIPKVYPLFWDLQVLSLPPTLMPNVRLQFDLNGSTPFDEYDELKVGEECDFGHYLARGQLLF